MASKLMKGVCLLLLSLLLVDGLPQRAEADSEPTAMKGGPVLYLAAGVMALNVGATIANGAALVSGKPNRQNGMFGLVLGSATMAAAAVSLAFADSDNDSERFSVVLGGLGLASTLTGYLNVRNAGDNSSKTEQSKGTVRKGAGPQVVVGLHGPGQGCGCAIGVQVGF